MTRAGSATTDRALDVYINGDGYLPTKNSDGVVKYTRVGVLSFDLSGNLVDSNGNQVLGFRLDDTTKNAQLNADGTTTTQNLVAIKVSPEDLDKYTGVAIGQNGEITAIQEGDPTFTPSADTGWMASTPTVTATSLYSGAVTMNVTRTFSPVTYTGPATAVKLSSNADIDASTAFNVAYDSDGTHPYTLTYTNGGVTRTAYGTADTSVTPNTLTFTGLDDVTGGATGTLTIPLGAAVGTGYSFTDGAAAVSIGTVGSLSNYNITATTVDKSGSTVTLNNTWNGTATSVNLGDMIFTLNTAAFQTALNNGMTNVEIGNVGAGPGEPVKIAHIAVAKFTNPNGLSQDGEGYYIETTNSGEAVATIPGNGGTGTFRAGALEMSNVDLSREFTEMIITQRGFQANTRMITTSDEMLSELVSMKR
jgi:flagellar hook protein FlgE